MAKLFDPCRLGTAVDTRTALVAMRGGARMRSERVAQQASSDPVAGRGVQLALIQFATRPTRMRHPSPPRSASLDRRVELVSI